MRVGQGRHSTRDGSDELRRAPAVEAALEVFGEHGYDAANASGMHAIAHRSGVPPATLYRLFGDRTGLYRATVALAAERFVEIVVGARQAAALCGDPHDRARTFLHQLLGGVRRQPEVWCTLTDRPRNPSAAAVLAGVQAQVRAAVIEGALADGRRSQPALGDREAEWAARFLYGGLAEVLREHLREASDSEDLALVTFLVTVAAPRHDTSDSRHGRV